MVSRRDAWSRMAQSTPVAAAAVIAIAEAARRALMLTRPATTVDASRGTATASGAAEGATFGHPEVVVEAAAQVIRLAVEPVREGIITPHLSGEDCAAALRVVDVPLDLTAR